MAKEEGGTDWKCPHCNSFQIVTGRSQYVQWWPLNVGVTIHGHVGVRVAAIRCANPECKEVTLDAMLGKTKMQANGTVLWLNEAIQKWQLRPASSSKPQPSYIPAVLREDYLEACLIRDLSPKASATLSRRCLQGMIRDFCEIRKPKLSAEINEPRRRVDAGDAPKGVASETMDAIDAVREVGNIGAHMKMNISEIVEVDPNEAQALIDLIEMLFDEWYVAKQTRTDRLAKLTEIAQGKKKVKVSNDAAAASNGSPNMADSPPVVRTHPKVE